MAIMSGREQAKPDCGGLGVSGEVREQRPGGQITFRKPGRKEDMG